jgi:hypothetical protein
MHLGTAVTVHSQMLANFDEKSYGSAAASVTGRVISQTASRLSQTLQFVH